MAISREEVLHIAHLARLRLSDEEADVYAEQLARILSYADALRDAPDADEGGEGDDGAEGDDVDSLERAEAGSPLRSDEARPDELRRPVAEVVDAFEEGMITLPRLSSHEEEAP